MRAVEPKVLVHLLVRDDGPQIKAAEFFVQNGAWVSHLVLVETLWVLDAVPERTSDQIAIAVDLLLNHKTLPLQDADVVTLIQESFRARPSLGFSDCPVLEIARKAAHVPLGTFDKNLAKLEGARGISWPEPLDPWITRLMGKWRQFSVLPRSA